MAKPTIIVDASQLDMMQLCWYRYKLRYLDCKSGGRADQLDRGTLIHTGLEKYFLALREGKHFSDACQDMILGARAAASANELDLAIVARVIEVLEEYVDYWRVADQNLEILEVEAPFIYVLDENEYRKIVMTGKIDLLVNEHSPDYFNLPYDHKSYDRKYPVKKLSNQFMNYSYATKSNFLVVDRVGFQTSLKPHEKFIRHRISYDPIILEEWRQNTIVWLDRYLDCVAEQVFPQNFTSCDKFNRQCEYTDVCESSGKEAKFFKINSVLNDIEPWDVTKVLNQPNKDSEVG